MSNSKESFQFSKNWQNALDRFTEYTNEDGGTFELGIRTSRNYLDQIKRFIKFMKLKEINDLNIEDLRTFVQDLRKKKRKQAYIAFSIAAIKSAFDLWDEIGLCENNPFFEFKLINRRRKGKRKKSEEVTDKALSAQAVLKILRTIEKSDSAWDLKYKDRDWLIFTIAYITGLREFELAEIYIKNIDLVKKTIKVIRKGYEEEEVLITDLLKIPYKEEEEIPNVIEKIKEYIIKAGLMPEDNLFGIKEKAIWYRVKKWVADAELGDKISTHFLRHTFGTHLGALNVSAFALQALMGHKDITTTQKYVRMQSAEGGEVLEKMGLFSGSTEGSKLHTNGEKNNINENKIIEEKNNRS